MKHKSILFVSPGGTATKAIRIKVSRVFIIIVFVVAGFSAYFIPSEKFRLKAAEVRQKHTLSLQNKMLHRRIGSALGTLGTLKQQIATLGRKKERVVELTAPRIDGSGGKSAERGDGSGAGARYARMGPEELLEHAERLESKMRDLAARLCPGNATANPFDSIPVCKPVFDGAIVSLCFGPTRDPFTGKESLHRGVDFSAPAGSGVIATAAGTVVRAENDAIWGNRIIIAHRDSVSTVYAHLGAVKTAQGRKVKRGEVIGTIGLSGLTTGPHVHYEIWRRGEPVDPATFFYPVTSEALLSARR